MASKKILISGAGIAGLGLAHLLARDGHQVVAIDRAARFDPRGHFIGLKGTGVKVIEAMGFLESLKRFEVPMRSSRFVRKDGREMRRNSFSETDAALGGYLMVRRADLHRVLFETLPRSVDVRFGHSLSGIEQNENEAVATLEDGSSETFDAVIGADGVHSNTRGLAFPDLGEERLRGYYIATLIHHHHDLDPKFVHVVVGDGRNTNFLPMSSDQMGVILYQDDKCPVPPIGADGSVWRKYFEPLYADFPDYVGRTLAGLQDDDDVFADVIALVPARSVAKGRVGLVGDAGYCPTFFSGMGAALALQGAFCLARRLNRIDDVSAALKSYETTILPVAREYQSGARKMREIILARSKTSQFLRDTALTWTPRWLFERQARSFYHTELQLNDL
jgi:2-polyprenyl-6-methoxyphenol hydroxylase-like FAD-dependent oxidoreductase